MVLTGSLGVGKTYTAMSVLDHMINNHPDMTPVKVHSAMEFNRVVDVAENLIVFVDDLGGDITSDDADIIEWNRTSSKLSNYLKDKKLFIIFTADKRVIEQIKSKSTRLRNMMYSEALVDLDESDNAYSKSEKTELCLKYAKSKDIPIDQKSAALLDTGDASVGFPLICKLMTRSNFKALSENPIETINHQVNTVSTDAKSHFIVLLLTFLFGGQLPRVLNESQNHCYDRVLCFVKIRKNYGKICSTAEGLVGTVLKYNKEILTYSFVHPGLLLIMMKWLWIHQRGVFIELCPLKYFNCLRTERNDSVIEMVPNDLFHLEQTYFNDVLDRFRPLIYDTDDQVSVKMIAALKLWECHDFIQTAQHYLGIQFFVPENHANPSLFSYLAQFNKHVALSKMLDYAADDNVTVSDSELQMAMALACRYTHFNVFKTLLEHCDTLPAEVLLAAAEGGDVEIMKLIATKVHDLNVESKDNVSTIHIACLHGYKNLVQYLFNRANDSVLLKDSKGRSILHYAVIGGNKRVLKFLLSNMETYDTDLLVRTKTGTTLLHTACECGWLNIVKHICKLYPSMMLSVDCDGLLPVDCAVIYGHVDCFNFLKSQQKASNGLIQSELGKSKVKAGRTDLHLACLSGRLRMVKYLCKTYPDMINSENKESFLPVHDAILGENIDILDYFIDEIHGPLIVTSDGRTLLHIAAFTEKLEVVKHICLRFPKLLKSLDLDGNTVGHDASASGNVEVLQHLVEQGIDVKARNYDGCSMLHDAAYFGRLDMVRYLCDMYPDLTQVISKSGYSPAHAAALGGNVDLMKYLLSSSGEQNVVSHDDSTLLHEAAYSGQLKMVQFLCSTYPEMMHLKTKNSFTPCHYAVQEGNEEVTLFLLGEMCDANVLTGDNETFLHIAAYNGRLGMVKYFAREFPELLDMVDSSGASVLHANARGGNVETMLYLLELGLDPTLLSENGSTLLHLAAYDGRLEMVQLLCERFPNMIDITDVSGHSAGHYAAGSGSIDVFKCLVAKGVDPLAQTENGSTCLLKAAYTGVLDMVKYLVETYSDLLEIVDQYQCTAAHYAACEGHENVLKFLLSMGISPYNRTIDGHSVLHIAAFHGRLEVVVFLCKEYPDLIPLEDKAGQTVWMFAESGGHEHITEFLQKMKGKKFKRPKDKIHNQSDDGKTCGECFRDYWSMFCNRIILCFCRHN